MRITSSGKLGLTLILISVGAFALITAVMATRDFAPVDMPASLSPGHFSTGIFKINAEGSYWVRMYPTVDSGCYYGDFNANWTLLRDGLIVSRQPADGGWSWGSFYARRGEYKVDVEVISAAPCISSVAPRLEIWSYDAYSGYAGVREASIVFGLPLMVIGLVLLVRSVTAAKPTRKFANDIFLSDVRGQQTPDLSMRRPLIHRFSGMPAFALLACPLLLALISIFMSITPLMPRGHYVRLTRPKTAPLLTGVREEPVIVAVRRGSPEADRPELSVNSQPVTWEELRKTLRAELSRHADRVVYVDGDYSLPYQDIAQVVDIAREAWPGVPVVLLTPELKQALEMETKKETVSMGK